MSNALRDLPKVELHLHLETSLRLRRLPEYLHSENDAIDDPHLIADPGAFTGYDRLRRLRYAGRAGRISDEVYTPANITRITSELLSAAAAQHVRYVEVRVGGRRGFSLIGVRPMVEAMVRAVEEAETRHGVKSGIIITVVRERGPEEAERIIAAAAAVRDSRVVGIDLAGDEANYPPALFVRAIGLARDAGLGITVHAGEFTGTTDIWTSLYQLGAQRVGHGIHAVDDPELLAYLREHKVTLELCPTSNLRLGLVPSLAEHPLRTFLKAGVLVTVNSDDPLLLNTDLTRELSAVQAALGLSLDTITTLMRTAARAAFQPAGVREALEREITQGVAKPLPS